MKRLLPQKETVSGFGRMQVGSSGVTTDSPFPCLSSAEKAVPPHSGEATLFLSSATTARIHNGGYRLASAAAVVSVSFRNRTGSTSPAGWRGVSPTSRRSFNLTEWKTSRIFSIDISSWGRQGRWKARHGYVRIFRIIVHNNRQPKTCTWWTLTNLPSRSWRSLLSILLRATRSSSTNPTLRSFKPWKMNLWTSFMSWILLQRTKKLTSLLISLSSLLMSSECLPNYDCQLKLNLDMYINVPDITIRKAFLYFLPGCTTATIPLKIPNCVIWKSNRQSEAPAWFSTTSWSGK